MRFEIELQDTTIDSVTGFQVQPFKILDHEARSHDSSQGYVSDSTGEKTVFYDLENFTDVPSYVNRYVSVYSCDRSYGGPEEGGWWFDDVSLVLTVPAFRSSVEAIKALLTENYGPLDKDEYRVNVELNAGESVRTKPQYE